MDSKNSCFKEIHFVLQSLGKEGIPVAYLDTETGNEEKVPFCPKIKPPTCKQF